MLSFITFRGQTSKNVHDDRKVCLKTTLCVFVCFIKFYALILDEIDARGIILVTNHIWYGNVHANIPKDQPRVLEEDPLQEPKAVKTSPTYGWLDDQ